MRFARPETLFPLPPWLKPWMLPRCWFKRWQYRRGMSKPMRVIEVPHDKKIGRCQLCERVHVLGQTCDEAQAQRDSVTVTHMDAGEFRDVSTKVVDDLQRPCTHAGRVYSANRWVCGSCGAIGADGE